MPMHRWIASAAGGISQRLKPGAATIRALSSNPRFADIGSPVPHRDSIPHAAVHGPLLVAQQVIALGPDAAATADDTRAVRDPLPSGKSPVQLQPGAREDLINQYVENHTMIHLKQWPDRATPVQPASG